MQNRKMLECLGAGLLSVFYLFSFPDAVLSADNPDENNPVEVVSGKTSPSNSSGGYYVVKPGDTLWSISNAQYTDPFLWPKLWGKNEQIPHPDKIYPGQKIFLPSEQVLKEVARQESEGAEGSEAVAEDQMTAGQPMEVQPEEGLPAIAPETEVPAEKEVVPKEEPVQREEVEEEPSAAAPSLPVSLADFFSSGYVARNGDSELKQEAEVIGSEFKHELLGAGDLIYIFAQDKAGKRFRPGTQVTLYSLGRTLHHPSTHKLFGKVVRIIGVAEIESEPLPAAGRLTHSARLVKTFDQVKVGDRVALYQPPDPDSLDVEKSSFPGKMRGVIVAAKEPKELLGQNDIVYLDKGSRQGVRPGHHLVVFKEGTSVPSRFRKPGANNHFPERIVADLEVITVHLNTATAVIVTSTEPVYLGDPVAEAAPLQ